MECSGSYGGRIAAVAARDGELAAARTDPKAAGRLEALEIVRRPATADYRLAEDYIRYFKPEGLFAGLAG